MIKLIEEAAGERTFELTLKAPIPGGPYRTGHAVLVLRTTSPGDRPAELRLRIHPSKHEFMAKLPGLAKQLGANALVLGHGLDTGEPIVEYVAQPAVLQRLPAGLATTAAWQACLAKKPAVWNLADYALDAIGFASGVAAT